MFITEKAGIWLSEVGGMTFGGSDLGESKMKGGRFPDPHDSRSIPCGYDLSSFSSMSAAVVNAPQ